MNDIMTLAALAAMLLAVGGVAGILAGLLGVGGGLVLVLAFYHVFTVLGYDSPQLMQMCLGTSLATIVVTSLRSMLAHDRRGAIDWDVLKTWAPGIVVGAVLGVFGAAVLRSETLQVIFGVLAMAVALYMLFGQSNWRLGQRMPKGLHRLILSPMVGFLSVLMGIGGGSFGVPIMTLYNMPIHRAVGTAAGFGVIIAVPSVIGFLTLTMDQAPPLTIGSVNLVAFGLIVVMTLLTAPMGASLAHRMDPAPLKKVFGIFLMLIAANMIRLTFV